MTTSPSRTARRLKLNLLLPGCRRRRRRVVSSSPSSPRCVHSRRPPPAGGGCPGCSGCPSRADRGALSGRSWAEGVALCVVLRRHSCQFGGTVWERESTEQWAARGERAGLRWYTYNSSGFSRLPKPAGRGLSLSVSGHLKHRACQAAIARDSVACVTSPIVAEHVPAGALPRLELGGLAGPFPRSKRGFLPVRQADSISHWANVVLVRSDHAGKGSHSAWRPPQSTVHDATVHDARARVCAAYPVLSKQCCRDCSHCWNCAEASDLSVTFVTVVRGVAARGVSCSPRCVATTPFSSNACAARTPRQ